MSSWHPLTKFDCARLAEARLRAHHAAQWLARAARAYIAPRPGDAHTNLGWDGALGGLRTHRLPDGTRIGLRFSWLALTLISGESASLQMALDGHTDADVRAWLGDALSARGFDARALDTPSPYEMPAHKVARGASYAGAQLTDALTELAAWYANASFVLGRVRDQLVARGFNAPGVRCWPHHFDLDSLIHFPGKDAEDVRTMGVGFSPGDEYYNEPYFYVGIHPMPDVLPALPAVGHWHTDEFTAAIATASRITTMKDQEHEVEDVLRAAIEIAIAALRR